MDLDLRGRSCVITGASRGIGRAIALGLAAEGANVAICARQEGPLREAARDIEALGVTVHAAACDVANETELAAFLDGARAALGRVDVLIHNASALAVGPDAASWDASLAVDLLPAVRACSQVLPWMREQGSGSVLLVSSISGIEAAPTPDFGYASAKAALIAYAKKLSVHEAPHGIRVNALAPGSIEFDGGGEGLHPVGPHGHAGGGGRRGRLSRLAARPLGDWRVPRGRRRPASRHSLTRRPDPRWTINAHRVTTRLRPATSPTRACAPARADLLPEASQRDRLSPPARERDREPSRR